LLTLSNGRGVVAGGRHVSSCCAAISVEEYHYVLLRCLLLLWLWLLLWLLLDLTWLLTRCRGH
jgi:hypothetical protein